MRVVACRRPPQQLVGPHDPRVIVHQHEGAVGKLIEKRIVVTLAASVWVDAFQMELGIDRVSPFLPRMKVAPELDEALVVRVAAKRARTVAGGERRCLVEEEELRELSGLEQRASVPSPELELTGDPPLAIEAPADATMFVVETATVAVDEPASRDCDKLTQWCDAILPQCESS